MSNTVQRTIKELLDKLPPVHRGFLFGATENSVNASCMWSRGMDVPDSGQQSPQDEDAADYVIVTGALMFRACDTQPPTASDLLREIYGADDRRFDTIVTPSVAVACAHHSLDQAFDTFSPYTPRRYSSEVRNICAEYTIDHPFSVRVSTAHIIQTIASDVLMTMRYEAKKDAKPTTEVLLYPHFTSTGAACNLEKLLSLYSCIADLEDQSAAMEIRHNLLGNAGVLEAFMRSEEVYKDPEDKPTKHSAVFMRTL